MKRFLKPTGRILTTAVFTSTALETLVPNAAVPTPIPDPLPPDASRQMTPDDRPSPKAKTIIPPEAMATQEFTQRENQPSTQFQIHIDPRSPNASASEPQLSIDHWGGALAETSPSVPPINFVLQDIPDLDGTTALTTHDDSFVSHAVPHQQQVQQPQIQQQHHNQEAEANEDELALESTLEEAMEATDQANTVDVGSAQTETLPVSNSHIDQPSSLSTEVIDETREWLDAALARIVNRDRINREIQLRTNLIESAHEHLAQGNVDQARLILENPALTDTDRDEVLAAIAEIESNVTYPFVSAEQALAMTSQSVRSQPLPSREWLLEQMDEVVTTLDPNCYFEEPQTLSVSAFTQEMELTTHTNSYNSTTLFKAENGRSNSNAFLSGSEFLAGVGHQPPSTVAKRSSPPLAHSNTQHQATRQNDCAPTFGQNIGGLTFATLSGYQWMSQFSRPGNALRMVLPLAVPAAITSHFGWRTHPIYGNRRFHFGIDFGAPMGTPVIAAVSGRVETNNYLDGYGLTVILENQELEQRTLYAHMSGIAVQSGTWVEQGDVIGWVGSTGNSTGPHLHFEVHQFRENEWVAVDPLQAAAQLMANRGGVGVQ